jgi:glycosyltransferase involved in cell wall biosynthesis
MSTTNSKVCLIIPCYNEEGNIKNLYKVIEENLINLKSYDVTYLFINDGSKDSTWEVMTALSSEFPSKVLALNLSRNFGKEAALLAGIEQAPLSDAYLTLDADLQDDPSIIIDMLEKLDTGYDIVYGQRSERKDSLIYIACTKIFYYFMDLATKGAIPKNVADFYVFNERVRQEFIKMQESVRFTRGLLFATGFKKAPVPYVREKRIAGTTSFNFIKLAKFSIDGLTSFSTLPLHFISFIGIIGCILSILGAIIYVVTSIYLGLASSSNGWASIILLITFFGSLQIMMLGIISEYIARNTIEIKNRQKYIVMDKINF